MHIELQTKNNRAAPNCSPGNTLLVLAVCYVLTFSLPRPSQARPGVFLEPIAHSHRLIELVAVFGKDTRKPLPSDQEWFGNAIGRLQHRGRRYSRYCTAFCVDREIIATSAHCLFAAYPNNRKPSLQAFRFNLPEALSRRARRFARIRGKTQPEIEINVVSGATFYNRPAFYDLSNDWALVRLSMPLCDQVLPATLRTTDRPLADDEIFSVGFIGDSQKLSLASDCYSKAVFDGVLWHQLSGSLSNPEQVIPNDCDIAGGQSGSPLMVMRGERPSVLGVQGGAFLKYGVYQRRYQAMYNYAIGVSAFYRQIEFLKTESQVPSRETVRKIQKLLLATGDLRGSADGLFGFRTRQAIIDYQRRNKRFITGLPADHLIAAVEKNPTMPLHMDAVLTFENYLYNSSHTNFKSFAWDASAAIFGMASGGASVEEAMNAAKMECYLKGGKCEVYALGDRIVWGWSDERLAELIHAYKERVFRLGR